MQLRPEQLSGHLNKGLRPVYLVHGDEALLRLEAASAIRAAAHAAGVTERILLEIEPGFDWTRLTGEFAALSLFSSRRLIELRLPAKRIDAAARAALTQAAQGLDGSDDLLLVLTDKLDAGQRKAGWYQAIEQNGVTVAAWPVDHQRLPAWIESRLRARGLIAEPEAIELLAARGEGNLLAIAQEIEKLLLLADPSRAGGHTLDAAELRRQIASSARYDVFDLSDAALHGDPERVLTIHQGLRAEGVELPVLLWALTREIRLLARLHGAREQGCNSAAIFKAERVWEARQRGLIAAGRRLPAARARTLLRHCARIDRIIKGREGIPGEAAWDELLELALALAGHDLQTPSGACGRPASPAP